MGEELKMINGIRISHLAPEFKGDMVDVPLNSKEMQLALDKSDNMNWCWEQMCKSVRYRGGPDILGNYELHFIRVNGVDRVLH